MKTKLVKRHCCDFCKRSGQSAFHIRRHEAACTANPNRVCRMCEAGIEVSPRRLSPLVALLVPDTEWHGGPDTQHAITKTSLDELLREVDHCPACALWVLRAAKAFHPDWDYKSAKKDHRVEVNAVNER